MAFDKTNTFTLSRNERREKDTHPEYTGTLNVNGVEYWLSAWVRDGQRGKFFSGAIKPKDSAPNRQSSSANRTAAPINDEIPF